MTKLFLFCVLSILACTTAQRITTIHLDGVQYFISRMNPYSPELNYFLAYQYCRSLGLQLASFETKEKAESMTTYLKNAGYGNYDFWTSGNRLGTGMFLWMSTGLPFNATFDFFENSDDAIQAGLLDPVDHNSNTSPQRTARDSSSGAEKGCVILKQPTLKWMPEDCSAVKDFICEQTRCYYYNYGSIPVSSAQGRPITSTTPRPAVPPMMSRQPSTTPLPILMSTNGLFAKKALAPSESQPSFVSLKLNHERALESEYDDLEADTEEHDDADAEETEHEHDSDSNSDNLNEQARELSDDVKEHVFPLNDNELQHDEVQSIEKLQLQLQSNAPEYEKADAHLADADTDADTDGDGEADEQSGQAHNNNNNADDDAADLANTDSTAEVGGGSSGGAASAESDNGNNNNNKAGEAERSPATLNVPQQTATIGDKSMVVSALSAATTESPAIEVRLKQIAQDFEKMASDEHQHRNDNHNSNNNNNDEITPQSSLSLSDLIRTLRPNDKQIIPQIDSDYSNAMRVLGKTSAVVNNEDSRKFKVLPDAHTHTLVI